MLGTLIALVSFAGPASAASPPTIEREWVTGITSTSAVLHAEINPNGALTKYKLQIDTTGNFDFERPGSCELQVPGVPCSFVHHKGEPLPPGLVEPPEGELPAEEGGQVVSVDMAEGATLQPGTTYHFRAIAANGEPVIAGEDIQFTTLAGSPAEPPPVVPTQPGGGAPAALISAQVPSAVVASLGSNPSATHRPRKAHRKHRPHHRIRRSQH